MTVAIKGGRPKFELNEENRQQVELAVGFGLNQDQIGKLMNCDVTTLRKYFRHELDAGKEKLVMSIGSQLYKKAMKGDTISAIFLAKTKGGFRETVEHEGLPNNITVSFNLDDKKPIEAEVVKEKLTHG